MSSFQSLFGTPSASPHRNSSNSNSTTNSNSNSASHGHSHSHSHGGSASAATASGASAQGQSAGDSSGNRGKFEKIFEILSSEKIKSPPIVKRVPAPAEASLVTSAERARAEQITNKFERIYQDAVVSRGSASNSPQLGWEARLQGSSGRLLGYSAASGDKFDNFYASFRTQKEASSPALQVQQDIYRSGGGTGRSGLMRSPSRSPNLITNSTSAPTSMDDDMVIVDDYVPPEDERSDENSRNNTNKTHNNESNNGKTDERRKSGASETSRTRGRPAKVPKEKLEDMDVDNFDISNNNSYKESTRTTPVSPARRLSVSPSASPLAKMRRSTTSTPTIPEQTSNEKDKKNTTSASKSGGADTSATANGRPIVRRPAAVSVFSQLFSPSKQPVAKSNANTSVLASVTTAPSRRPAVGVLQKATNNENSSSSVATNIRGRPAIIQKDTEPENKSPAKKSPVKETTTKVSNEDETISRASESTSNATNNSARPVNRSRPMASGFMSAVLASSRAAAETTSKPVSKPSNPRVSPAPAVEQMDDGDMSEEEVYNPKSTRSRSSEKRQSISKETVSEEAVSPPRRNRKPSVAPHSAGSSVVSSLTSVSNSSSKTLKSSASAITESSNATSKTQTATVDSNVDETGWTPVEKSALFNCYMKTPLTADDTIGFWEQVSLYMKELDINRSADECQTKWFQKLKEADVSAKRKANPCSATKAKGKAQKGDDGEEEGDGSVSVSDKASHVSSVMEAVYSDLNGDGKKRRKLSNNEYKKLANELHKARKEDDLFDSHSVTVPPQLVEISVRHQDSSSESTNASTPKTPTQESASKSPVTRSSGRGRPKRLVAEIESMQSPIDGDKSVDVSHESDDDAVSNKKGEYWKGNYINNLRRRVVSMNQQKSSISGMFDEAPKKKVTKATVPGVNQTATISPTSKRVIVTSTGDESDEDMLGNAVSDDEMDMDDEV